MMSRFNRLGRGMLLGLAATVLVAGAAGAQDDKAAAGNRILPGLSADDITSIMTEHQIQWQKNTVEGSTDPWLMAELPSGSKFFVRLQGCDAQGATCQVIQYGALFVTTTEIPVADFNIFNGRYAFAKAYKDPQNQMFIEHAVAVAGGIRRAAVEVNMFVFFSMADAFAKFLSERLSTVSASLDRPKSGAITNAGGPLPAGSSLASFRKAAAKHPGIVNTVRPGKSAAWPTKK